MGFEISNHVPSQALTRDDSSHPTKTNSKDIPSHITEAMNCQAYTKDLMRFYQTSTCFLPGERVAEQLKPILESMCRMKEASEMRERIFEGMKLQLLVEKKLLKEENLRLNVLLKKKDKKLTKLENKLITKKREDKLSKSLKRLSEIIEFDDRTITLGVVSEAVKVATSSTSNRAEVDLNQDNFNS